MTYLDTIRGALLTVTDRVSHFFAADKTPPYLVWGEDGQSSLALTDEGSLWQGITGTVDLFTNNLDGEPLADKVQQALNGVCIWELSSVRYEEDICLLHYQWKWELGTLNQWIALQKGAISVDAIGNHRNVWTDCYACQAAFCIEGKMSVEAEAQTVGITVERSAAAFTVLLCPETEALTSTGYRVLYRDEIYNIIFIDHMDCKRNTVKLHCQRVRR